MLLCSAVTGWNCTIVIQVHLSDQFPSMVHCRMALLLLCFLIIGIQACGISIPLSLLMLLRWSYQWIASFTWVNWSERCTNPSFGIPFNYSWAQEHVGDMSSIDFFTWRGLAVCDPHPQWPFCETKDYISLLTTIYFTTSLVIVNNWFIHHLCFHRDMKHLGGLESTQEARVALGYASSNSYASFMLSKLPACFISRWTHRWRMNQLFNNIFNPMKKFFLKGFVCWCHEHAQ